MRRFTYDEAEAALALGPVECACNYCGSAHVFRQVQDEDITSQFSLEEDWVRCLIRRTVLGLLAAPRFPGMNLLYRTLGRLDSNAYTVLGVSADVLRDPLFDMTCWVRELNDDYGYEYIDAIPCDNLAEAAGLLVEDFGLATLPLYRPLLRGSMLMASEFEAQQRIIRLRISKYLASPFWDRLAHYRQTLRQPLVDAANRAPGSADCYNAVAQAINDLVVARERFIRDNDFMEETAAWT